MALNIQKSFKLIPAIAVLSTALLFTPYLVFSQELAFENLSVDQGLSQSVVLCIYQDSRGFLWIGTQDGLNRYDGYQFLIYSNNPQNQFSISDNYINDISEDRSGNLWIATNGGLNYYDRYKENFISYKNDPLNPTSIGSNALESVLVDKNGIVWAGGYGGGLSRFNPDTKSFSRFTHDPSNPNSISNDTVNAIVEDSDGSLWIGTANGLNRLNTSSGQFFQYKTIAGNPNSLSDNYIRCLAAGGSGNLWIGTDKGGLSKYDGLSGKFKSYRFTPGKENRITGNSINSIFEDSQGYIWIGVWNGGINKFDPQTESFSVFKNNPFDLQSLSQNDVNVVYKDKFGVLWVGTYGAGLDKSEHRFAELKNYIHLPSYPYSLSNNRVFAIYKDKSGILWIGTWGGGLNKVDSQSGRFIHYKHDARNLNSISDDRITAIFEDREGYLWIGTLDGGLNRMNTKDNSFTHYRFSPNNPFSLSSDRIASIAEDNYGNIWIATIDAGVSVLDKERKLFKRYVADSKVSGSLSNSRTTQVFKDISGNMWIGTYSGLNLYSKGSDSFVRIHSISASENNVINDRISSIHQTADGTVWIGTFGRGLHSLVKDRATNLYYFTKPGYATLLPNNYIYKILSDSENNLWVSTNRGLVRINTKDNSQRVYDKGDGLQIEEFKDGAFYDKTAGTLYFGGIKGFCSFSLKSIRDEISKPATVLTNFKIFNKPVLIGDKSPLKKSITETNEIELTYKDRLFSIEFACLHFSAPERNTYTYILEGYDLGWNFTDSKIRSISYSNLPSGTYTFKIKSANHDGIWDDIGASLVITVLPPFWGTWWFRFSAAFVIIFSAVFIYRKRVSAIKHRNIILSELVAERTKELEEAIRTKDKFFSIIAHDLRNPLNIFMGYSEILNEEIDTLSKEEIKLITRNIKESSSMLSKLIENLLQWARVQMDGFSVEATSVDLAEICYSLLLSLRLNIEKKNLYVENSVSPYTFVFADYNMVTTVIRNLLNNAVKFTPRNGKITISAYKNHKSIITTITDTGVGIASKNIGKIFRADEKFSTPGTNMESGSGLGLILCKEFIERNGGEIWIESQLNQGTKVCFTLPISTGAEEQLKLEV